MASGRCRSLCGNVDRAPPLTIYYSMAPIEPLQNALSIGGAKGTRTPALTRQNSGLPAASLRLVPIQYRSLPAVSFRVLTASRAVGGGPEQGLGDRPLRDRSGSIGSRPAKPSSLHPLQHHQCDDVCVEVIDGCLIQGILLEPVKDAFRSSTTVTSSIGAT